ncbi:MAG: hypothetical protein Q9170_003466 [Blastenia crenularia]
MVITLDEAQISSSKLSRGTDFGVPENPHLTVSYHYSGRQIAPGQVFSAFLKGNTFFSANDGAEQDVKMLTISADRSVRLMVRSAGPMRPGIEQLTWEFARLAVKAIWYRLIMNYRTNPEQVAPRWETLTFEIEYDQVQIGQGYLL